jgi:hypothetical protein
MIDYKKEALVIIGAPRHVNLNGKKISPEMLLSSALAEPMMYWLAQSLSQRMHGDNLLGVRVIADHTGVSGAKMAKSDPQEVEKTRISSGLGLASGLLILCESVDQILMPAKLIPDFDYDELLMDFRKVVRRDYGQDAAVSPNDFHLNDLIFERLHRPISELPNREMANRRDGRGV